MGAFISSISLLVLMYVYCILPDIVIHCKLIRSRHASLDISILTWPALKLIANVINMHNVMYNW